MSFIKSIILPKDKALFRYIFTLAFPVIISNISRVMMGLVDTMMIGHLGAKAIAGVGMASMVTWTTFSIGIAFRTGTQTFVSRRWGEKKYDECALAMRNMHLFVLVISIPITILCVNYTSQIMSFFIKDSDTLSLCIDYAKYLYLSIYFLYASFVFQGFFTGIEETKLHMKVTLASNLINFYLNVGLIFGSEAISDYLNGTIFQIFSNLWILFPFPELGVKGAAIGTLVATMWLCIHYSLYLFKKDIRNKFSIFTASIDFNMLKRQLIVAYPIALQETLVMFSFTIFYKLIAIVGIIQLAATQIVFKIMHASFMPAIGVGQACSTLVGKYLGEENPDKAEQSVYESLRGSFLMMGSVGLCFICFADYIIPLFTNDVEVIQIAIPVLRFIGLLQIVDAVCFTLWFALTGAGDTKIPALVDVLTHWILFIPACYILGIVFGYGYWGMWFSFGLHLTYFAGFVFWRFRKGHWKEIKI